MDIIKIKNGSDNAPPKGSVRKKWHLPRAGVQRNVEFIK
jgi:hypothetical protein